MERKLNALAPKTEWHRKMYAEFCRLEIASGGPDPCLDIVAANCKGLNMRTAAWRAGCHVNTWVIASGAMIWDEYPDPGMVANDPEELVEWLTVNKEGLPARRDRRAVYDKKKMAQCAITYGDWVINHLPALRDASYEELWDSVSTNVRYFGRYATLKVLESLRRMEIVSAAASDIRAQGAWSPRLTLSWLFPDGAELLNNGGNKVAAIKEVDAMAQASIDDVEERAGIKLNYYQQEVLLCNYRQGITWRHPGRSHDSELGYWFRTSDYWGRERLAEAVRFFSVRKQLYPKAYLGELNGWDGNRKELEACFEEHGYFWSDGEYSYKDTEDLSEPVRWA